MAKSPNKHMIIIFYFQIVSCYFYNLNKNSVLGEINAINLVNKLIHFKSDTWILIFYINKL